jgi:cytochrome P450
LYEQFEIERLGGADMNRPIPTFASPRVLGYMSEFRHTPIDLLLRIAREYPEVARFRFGAFNPVVVNDPALAHEVLVEKTDAFLKSYGLTFFARPLLGKGLVTLERDAHRKRRRLVAPSFMPKRIAGYATEIAQRAEASAARIAEHTQFDLSAESMRVTLEVVMKTLFDAQLCNASDTVADAFPRALSSMIESLTSPIPLPPPLPTPANLRLARAVRDLDRIIYRVIAERRASGAQGNDLLGVLLASRDQDDGSALTDHELRDELMTMMLAGHETTANTLAWTLYALTRAPEVRAKLEAELDALEVAPLGVSQLASLRYTAQVIKEAMRLYPPVYMVARRTTREVEIGPYKLNRGAVVFINIVGIHRRPDIYADPERFDPERFTPEREKRLPKHAYLPFSGGPRVCIGNHFAMMEAQLILATWLRRLRFELLEPTQRVDFEALITLRPKGGLPLRVHKRQAHLQPTAAATS